MSLTFQATAVILGKVAALTLGSPTVAAFLTNPWYIACLTCLGLQALFWQIVLRGIRLFVAYLVTSLNYFIILGASRAFFSERITPLHFAGATLIVAGVYLVVREDLE